MSTGFESIRLLLSGLLALGVWALWRRPRVAPMLGVLTVVNLLAWLAYLAPLKRPYALEPFTDRAFNLGVAACAAAGNSPLEHTQVGMASLEPFWSVAVALLSGFRPEGVVAVYAWLPGAVLVLLCAALYCGLRAPGVDDWERLLLTFAVFALASQSTSLEATTMFWPAVLKKPNHATGFVLIALLLGLRARRAPAWQSGLLLGALSWVFLLHWGYLCLGIVLAELLAPRGERRWRATAVTLFTGGAIGLPMFLHLVTGYRPDVPGSSAHGMWTGSSRAELMAQPSWLTLDLGIAFSLAAMGGLLLWRRRRSLDREILGGLLAGLAIWACYLFAPVTGFAPQSDDLETYVRFMLALTAGALLAETARQLEHLWALRRGGGALLAVLACVPFSFWSYWDPPRMDPYWKAGQAEIPAEVLDYTRWIRASTPRDAVFATLGSAGGWIPALTGRQVLLAGDARPPRDFAKRRALLRKLVQGPRPEDLRRASSLYRIRYLVIEDRSPASTGLDTSRVEHLLDTGAYEPAYRSPRVAILALKPGAM